MAKKSTDQKVACKLFSNFASPKNMIRVSFCIYYCCFFHHQNKDCRGSSKNKNEKINKSRRDDEG
jgi:hypothetical protein